MWGEWRQQLSCGCWAVGICPVAGLACGVRAGRGCYGAKERARVTRPGRLGPAGPRVF